MKVHSRILSDSKPIVESIKDIRVLSETYNSTNTKLFPKRYKFTSPNFIDGNLVLFENIGENVIAYIKVDSITKDSYPFLYSLESSYKVNMVNEILANHKMHNPIIHSFMNNPKKSLILIYSIDCNHSNLRLLDRVCSQFHNDICYSLKKINDALKILTKINFQLPIGKTEYLLNVKNKAFILPTANLKNLFELKENGISQLTTKSKKQHSHERSDCKC